MIACPCCRTCPSHLSGGDAKWRLQSWVCPCHRLRIEASNLADDSDYKWHFFIDPPAGRSGDYLTFCRNALWKIRGGTNLVLCADAPSVVSDWCDEALASSVLRS